LLAVEREKKITVQGGVNMFWLAVDGANLAETIELKEIQISLA
jgi:hypothetical protein